MPTPLAKRQCCPVKTLVPVPDKLWQDLNNQTSPINEHTWHWWLPTDDALFQWPDDDLTTAALAAITGDLPLLAHMHEQHIDIHERTPHGNSLLTLAAMGGQLEVIRWLYALGLDIHHSNAVGTNALMYAAAYGHLDVIEWLIDNGVSIAFLTQHTDDMGNDALMYAARHGQFGASRLLIALGAQADSRNHDKVNTLMLAANSGCYPLVKLLSKECNVHDNDEFGNSVVYFAAGGGHLDIIKLLYQYGADIAATNSWGNNAYSLAAASGSLETMQWLYEHASVFHNNEVKESALATAAQAGHLHIIKHLLQDNADSNNCVASCTAALMQAAREGHLDCVQYLYAQGALLGDDRDGYIVSLAASGGHLDLLQWADQEDANLHKSNTIGRNAAFLAAHSGHLVTLQWLHTRGVDIHLRDNFGRNALDAAALCGHFDVVSWLHGKNVDMTSKADILFNAVRFAQLSAIQWLSDIVDLQSLDHAGRNCLTFAVLSNNDQTPKMIAVIRWLYQQGLSISWQHLHDFLSTDFFSDAEQLAGAYTTKITYFYRKKLTEMLTYEDAWDLKNRITVADKKNLLRIFNIDCAAFDEDQLDKKLLSFKRAA